MSDHAAASDRRPAGRPAGASVSVGGSKCLPLSVGRSDADAIAENKRRQNLNKHFVQTPKIGRCITGRSAGVYTTTELVTPEIDWSDDGGITNICLVDSHRSTVSRNAQKLVNSVDVFTAVNSFDRSTGRRRAREERDEPGNAGNGRRCFDLIRTLTD